MGHGHRVRLAGKAGDLELRHRTDVTPAMERVSITRSDVHAWVTGSSASDRRALADALEDAGIHADPRSEHEVEAKLLAAIERGDLLAVRPQARGAAVPKTKPSAPPVAAAPEKKAAPVKISWINIQLVDEKKLPVAGVRYELTMPDKSTRSGVLDALGSAHVEGIQDGTCEIRFPDLDTLEWNVG